MQEHLLQFLQSMLSTPSPSGYERPIQDVIRAFAGQFAEVSTDWHGNVIAALFPRERTIGPVKIMLAGHCDQIGLMVQHIDAEGYLYVQPIGGWDMQILLGQYLTIVGRDGPVSGVISRKATHLLTNEERAKVPQFTDVWVDVGAKNREEAEKLVRPGDAATFALGVRELYVWARPAQAQTLDFRMGYLNVPFFLIRAVFYFAVWSGIAYLLNKWSLDQDRTGDPAIARKMQVLSGGGLVAYALTTTFASFDWLMSLDPHWYSTIYGFLIIGGLLAVWR